MSKGSHEVTESAARPSYHKRKEEKNEQEKRIHSGI